MIIYLSYFWLVSKELKITWPVDNGKRKRKWVHGKQGKLERKYIYFLLFGSHLKMEENEWSCVFSGKILFATWISWAQDLLSPFFPHTTHLPKLAKYRREKGTLRQRLLCPSKQCNASSFLFLSFSFLYTEYQFNTTNYYIIHSKK